MVKAKVLARYLVEAYEKFTDSSFDNSELRLHKLLYFSQRESLAIFGEPIIDETFEGWKHGPVLPELRSYFNEDYQPVEELGEKEMYIIANVLEQYAQYAPWTLRDMTHEETSWKRSRVGLNETDSGNVKILIDDIKLDALKVRIYDHLWGMYLDEFEDEPEYETCN